MAVKEREERKDRTREFPRSGPKAEDVKEEEEPKPVLTVAS